MKRCVLTFISKYTCWTYFQWPFSSFSPSTYFSSTFYSLLFLKSICLIFKQKNADNSTIYKYFKLLSHSTGIGLLFSVCRLLFLAYRFWFFSLFSFFRQFLSSLVFPIFRLHLKGSAKLSLLFLVISILCQHFFLSHWFIVSLCALNSHALNCSWQNLNETFRLCCLQHHRL